MEKLTPNDVLVVVPTYNEVNNIEPLLQKIFAAGEGFSVLFVDDASSDGTGEAINRAAEKYQGRIYLLSRPAKLGLGTAYIAGFRWALERPYQFIVEMDADLSHDPARLEKFLELASTSDVVVGSRYVEGGGTRNWGVVRQIISRFGSIYARAVLGINVADFTGGFNGWRRTVLETIDLNAVKSEGYAFQIELKYRAFMAGFNLIETPIVFQDRTVGASKMSSGIVFEAVWRVLLLRWACRGATGKRRLGNQV